jgi:hypothetical protein
MITLYVMLFVNDDVLNVKFFMIPAIACILTIDLYYLKISIQRTKNQLKEGGATNNESTTLPIVKNKSLYNTITQESLRNIGSVSEDLEVNNSERRRLSSNGEINLEKVSAGPSNRSMNSNWSFRRILSRRF